MKTENTKLNIKKTEKSLIFTGNSLVTKNQNQGTGGKLRIRPSHVVFNCLRFIVSIQDGTDAGLSIADARRLAKFLTDATEGLDENEKNHDIRAEIEKRSQS